MAVVGSLSTGMTPEEDAKFGFNREEMYKSNLAGTVDPYERHVFLCFRSPDVWPSRVEDTDTDLLPKLFSSALKARKNEMPVKTKLTISEGRDGTQFENGDVLLFPEMIKYKGLKDSDVDGFVDDVLVNGKSWISGVQELMTGSHIFVCAHGNRDKRCGVCGPVLIEKLRVEIESMGMEDKVSVSACSHVGGHKYAGNLVVYSKNLRGKIVGHWYGYVTPDDIHEILEKHIGKGVVIERLWRGQMGACVEGGGKDAPELMHFNEKQENKLPTGDGRETKKHATTCCNNDGTLCCCCLDCDGFSSCRTGKLETKEEQGEEAVPQKTRSLIQTLTQSHLMTCFGVVTAAAASVMVLTLLYKKRSC